ncbi:MAG TPA: DNA ligase D, partial [Vicinamibacterales bacterium]|nr:DNA ligase D [Vicinamibacterales bacterium]
ERRKILEVIVGKGTPMIRISRQVGGDGRALMREALERGWEGLIAKHAASQYASGKRTPDWRKIKIHQEQEFVIGGWTEPRQTRSHFGALLLGVYEGNDLVYCGHTGTGFNEKELTRLMRLLKPLETSAPPFREKPKTNQRPHWVRPELVAQIRFTEWTADGKLRHPVYLGLRDDKKPEEVRRESKSGSGFGVPGSRFGFKVPRSPRENPEPRTRTRNPEPGTRNPIDLIAQLQEIEQSKRDGLLTLPNGNQLKVGNLHKIFWPKQKLTKGDLFRYYARVAPVILPVLADRPLVMKRYPNGVAAPPFYQHRAEHVPSSVRVQTVSVVAKRPQIIGGTLEALIYTTQLAAISQDPWFSRVQHPEFADFAALDLDPADGVPFETVLDVARWIRDELDALGATGVPKTSGGRGLHIYLPLPAGTPYDAGLLLCQIIATVVTQKHPQHATTERTVAARGRRVYVDCLQNILGKTLAAAYSARATDYAGVSTPLTWSEVDEGVDREAFTILTVPDRVKKMGDLWAPLRRSKG